MHPRRRLNLFAFPPETSALFSMLIVASIMLALFIGSVIRFYTNLGDPISSLEITSQRFEISSAFLSLTCLSGLAAFGALCLAGLFYLRYPAQIRQRRNIRPLTEKDQPVQDHANRLAWQARIRSPVIEMPVHGLKGSDAQAFGVGKQQIIALDGGFRILRKTKPEIFNALLRHELAHFANADVGRSYFSHALWKSIRWLLVFPFLLTLAAIVVQGLILGIFGGGQLELAIAAIPSVLGLLIQWGFVLSMAGVIWARLLRTREFYADWRAALWGSQNGLQQILQEETEKVRSKTRLALWKFHPEARERLHLLEHPETLFKLSPIFIFLAGLLLSFLFAGLYFLWAAFIAVAEIILTLRDAASGLFYWILTGIWWGSFAMWVLLVFGLTGWLVNGVLLPQVQKQAVLDLLNKQGGSGSQIKLAIRAVMLVAGIEIGFFMTPFSQLAPNDPVGILVEILIILPILSGLAWWYLIYIKSVASRVSATQVGAFFSARRALFIKVASAGWVFLFFMPGVLLSRFIELGFPYFAYFNLGWLAFTLLLSPLAFAGTWLLEKIFLENQPTKCPHCRRTTSHQEPAIEVCEHCAGVLGEWLFISEKPVTDS
jgi:hypothetical protein